MLRYIKNNLLVSLIFLGTLSWSLTMIKSGWIYSFGMGFWGPNGHDGIWHVALINHLAKSLNWYIDMPVFSQVPLQNYHLGFDYLLAILHKLSGISSHALYFQIIPPLVAVCIGILTYKFVLLWRKSQAQALWSVFFVYFGGSWGWVVTLLRGEGIGGESMFWSQQAVSTLVNPPFATSLVFLLLGLIFLTKYLNTKKNTFLFLVAIIFAIIIEIKVYGGLLGLGGLGVVGLITLFREKNLKLLLISIISAILGFLFFTYLTKTNGNLIVYQPFWFLETMMAISDRLGWQRYFDALMAYKSGSNFMKLIPAYIVAFLIFWFGNLGARAIKDLWLIKNFKRLREIEIFLLSVVVVGVLTPTLFLQKGTPWNTIQFFYYSLFFSGILAGIAVGDWQEKQKNKSKVWLVGWLIVVLTLPTTISTLWNHYLPSRPPAKISNEEVEALNFLNKQPEGVVLTYPFDRKLAEKAQNTPPRPLYLYESTAYVAAFSAKPVYLEDEVNLNITDYNWRERREKVLSWLETLDQKEAYSFLRENNIKYIYWVKPQRASLGETQLGISRLFENREVDVYQVD